MEEWREQKLAILEQINPGGKDGLYAAFGSLAPGFADMAIDIALGGHCRPGLDIKTRQMVAIISLSALGTAPAQLETQIKGGLNVGWRPREIVEAIIHVTAFAGLPASMNGLFAARRVFDAMGIAIDDLEGDS